MKHKRLLSEVAWIIRGYLSEAGEDELVCPACMRVGMEEGYLLELAHREVVLAAVPREPEALCWDCRRVLAEARKQN